MLKPSLYNCVTVLCTQSSSEITKKTFCCNSTQCKVSRRTSNLSLDVVRLIGIGSETCPRCVYVLCMLLDPFVLRSFHQPLVLFLYLFSFSSSCPCSLSSTSTENRNTLVSDIYRTEGASGRGERTFLERVFNKQTKKRKYQKSLCLINSRDHRSDTRTSVLAAEQTIEVFKL